MARTIKVGDHLAGMYLDNTRGTVLDSSGTVVAVVDRYPDSGTGHRAGQTRLRVTALFSNGREESFLTRLDGSSDYTQRISREEATAHETP